MNTVSNDRDGLVHMIVESIKQSNVWKWVEDQMRRQEAGRHDQEDGDLYDQPDLDEFAEEDEFDDEGDDLADLDEADLDVEDAEDDLDAFESARRDHGERPVRAGRRRVDPSAAARKYAARFNTPGRRPPQSHGYRGRLTETTPSDELYGDAPGDEQPGDQWKGMDHLLPKQDGGYPTYCPEDADGQYARGHAAGRPADHYAKAREAQRMAAEAARAWVSREDHHVGRDAAGRYLAGDDQE
jgi:hypothetical protein